MQDFDYLWENAHLFGLLNLAMADGYIGSWEAKYHYSLTSVVLPAPDGPTKATVSPRAPRRRCR